MYKSIYNSPLGRLFLVSDGECLIGSYLENQKYFPNKILTYSDNNELSIFREAKSLLDKYFLGRKVDFSELKVSMKGTEFQKKIWEILFSIDYGQALSYKEVTQIYCEKNKVDTMSAQAVGSAVGRNPLLIFVPCHRVIKENGDLGGYVAGVENKKYLLDLEKAF